MADSVERRTGCDQLLKTWSQNGRRETLDRLVSARSGRPPSRGPLADEGASGRTTRFTSPRSSTRPSCGWSISVERIGGIEPISWAWRPRACDGCSWTTPPPNRRSSARKARSARRHVRVRRDEHRAHPARTRSAREPGPARIRPQATIVELRFFSGLTVEEIAEVAGVSPSTVKRELRTARIFLKTRLEALRAVTPDQWQRAKKLLLRGVGPSPEEQEQRRQRSVPGGARGLGATCCVCCKQRRAS